MTRDEAARALQQINGVDDLLEKALLLAALVSSAFRARGHHLVVVGGSAIEFYTEGAYMSGDIDFCRLSGDPIPLRLAQETIGELGGSGGPRSWKVAGMYVDLLGQIETDPEAPNRVVVTPLGEVKLAPPEVLLVERVLVSVYPQVDAEARLSVRSGVTEIKTTWTWEEWKARRPALKAVTDRVSPAPSRRTHSSSDRRLRAAFGGKRAP